MRTMIAIAFFVLSLCGTVSASCEKVYNEQIDGQAYTFTVDCSESWTGKTQKIDDVMFFEIEGEDGKRWKHAEPPTPLYRPWGGTYLSPVSGDIHNVPNLNCNIVPQQ